MQRRIQCSDSDREAIHRPEDAYEVVALHGQELLQRGTATLLIISKNHRPHVRNFFLSEEHMLGPAQANALCTERARLDRIAWDVGVRANL